MTFVPSHTILPQKCHSLSVINKIAKLVICVQECTKLKQHKLQKRNQMNGWAAAAMVVATFIEIMSQKVTLN